jgi:hydroxymethylglutaryl-CoA synthase
MMARSVGIDHLGVYVPGYVLSLDALATARGVPVEKILVGIGAQEMAVAPPWEDAVTLGANAAARALAHGQVSPDEIGLLLVATETGVDHAKPASIFLHELLGVGPNCRTFELKHACYSGTAGVMIAAEWIRSGAARGRKAVVVASDIARYDLHSNAEFTQGAGAVAMIVSECPRLFELDPVSGVFASNVYDFWRPLDRREAVVDGKFSLDCYLNALDGAVAHYRASVGKQGGEPLSPSFAALLYHTPFPKMAYKAHARLLEAEWRAAHRNPAELAAAVERSFAEQVDPSLGAARVVGNTYTASLYFCLAWLAEQRQPQLRGASIALFSYGSGCCAEFFTGRFSDQAPATASQIGLAEMLTARRRVSVAEYEAFATAVAHPHPTPAEPTGFCRFAGVRDDRRVYERSGSAA